MDNRTKITSMKTTLLLICTLLCLLFFSIQLNMTGANLAPAPEEAYTQVVNPEAAREHLQAQISFNSVIGSILSICSAIGLLFTLVSLFFLHRQRALSRFRVALLLVNICILITSAILFFVTLIETTQPEPVFMQLCRPWLDSYWARAVQHTQQTAMFLGFCCCILSGVNCMAFYFFYRRRQLYGED